MNKNTKKAKAARAKAEEALLQQVLYWIMGGAIMELLLLILNRYYVHYRAGEIEIAWMLRTVVKILACGSLACAGGAAFWWNGARKAGKNTDLPALLTIFMAGMSVSCFLTWSFSGKGLGLSIVAVPVVAVLAMVYYLYQHEFFLSAVEATLGILGVWICAKGSGGMYMKVAYAYVAVAVLLVAAVTLVCKKAQDGNGALAGKDGKSVRLFTKGSNYTFLYAGAVVTIGALICAALGIAPSILYAVQVAWLLGMAVYYTVKLM